ncbi:MAG: hypothetical protein H8D67_17330 [Deltaproteobacteria bacterium]|nr:hypothetical protein [Deltaproteobacteria bacterium]MBL7075337.1 hypothetical protein [candidate division KSB1 bacterium]
MGEYQDENNKHRRISFDRQVLIRKAGTGLSFDAYEEDNDMQEELMEYFRDAIDQQTEIITRYYGNLDNTKLLLQESVVGRSGPHLQKPAKLILKRL